MVERFRFFSSSGFGSSDFCCSARRTAAQEQRRGAGSRRSSGLEGPGWSAQSCARGTCTQTRYSWVRLASLCADLKLRSCSPVHPGRMALGQVDESRHLGRRAPTAAPRSFRLKGQGLCAAGCQLCRVSGTQRSSGAGFFAGAGAHLLVRRALAAGALQPKCKTQPKKRIPKIQNPKIRPCCRILLVAPPQFPEQAALVTQAVKLVQDRCVGGCPASHFFPGRLRTRHATCQREPMLQRCGCAHA